MQTSVTTIEKLLGTDFGSTITAELGIEDDLKEAQAEMIVAIGNHLFERVVFEILRELPKPLHEQFASLIGEEDMRAVTTLIQEHIPDSEALIQNIAREELAAIKARAKELTGK